jgi:DNA polymerase III subunit epsilon
MNDSRLKFERDQMIGWARYVLAHPDEFVILDTETTGLGPAAAVVQIGVIDLSGDVLMDSLVQPGFPIPPEATAIHHITDEMVKLYPDYEHLFAWLLESVLGKTIISYNANFDRTMLFQSGYGKAPQLSCHWNCAMENYASFWGDWNPKYRSFRWQPLPGAGHSALSDCRATLQLIKDMAAAKLSTEMVPLLSSPADSPGSK